MKNCPWFSLRSNSIESRFRSIRGGNFLAYHSVNLKKTKARAKAIGIRFAHGTFLLATLALGLFSTRNLRLFRHYKLKNCFSESRDANFGASLVDTRSIHSN